MLQMPSIIVSETSCLIVLENIGKLDLLKLVYEVVITTPEVAQEFDRPIPEWLEIKSATDANQQKKLEEVIDLGEASAIALALETNNCTLILDDLKARKIASQLNLHFTGTLGVIARAKELGLIEKIQPILEDMKKAGLRFSQAVQEDILRKVGE